MKLFFTDLDGTLLNSACEIGNKTKAALDKWVESGNRLILNSGRPLDSILEIKRLGALNYPGMLIVANNGSLIYDCDTSTILHRFGIPFEHVKYIMDVARKRGVHCQTYTDTHIVCEKENEHLTFYTNRIHLPYILTDDVVSVLPLPPQKLLAIDVNNHQNLESLRQELLPWAKGKVEMLYSCNELMEFIHYESGKGNAIYTVCNLLNVPIEASLAAGDANNDFSMIEAAGIGIAMKNATPMLKEMADIVTNEDNNHDGLVEVLERYM